MIYQVTVPSVGDVEEIRVLEWHGEPGHRFESGDLMVELETHKAIVEVRAGQAGVLRRILADAGNWQRIGLPLALFSDAETEYVPSDGSTLVDLVVAFEIV